MLKSFASLRSRAILLVLLAILPLLVLTLNSYLEERDKAILEMQRDEVVAVRNLAIIQETLISSTRQLLHSLSHSPQVQRRDQAACNRLFAGMLEQCPYYSILTASDPEGKVIASAPAVSYPVNVGDRLYFKRAIETRGFVVGEPILGRITKKYCFDLAYPILDDQGQFKGVLTAGIDLNWLGGVLAKSDLPPSTGLALTDATGKVLFRYPDPLKYTGKRFVDSIVKAMTSQDEGVMEGLGLPGDLRLLGFTRLAPPLHDMRLVIGIPRELAIRKVNAELWRHLIWLALVAALALTAARVGGKAFILQPVDKLLKVTRRLTHGDLAARTGAPYQPGELGQLALAFDQMADSLQERDADLQKTALELEQRVRELDRRSLELVDSNKELENFTYSVAHDLRAPLRAIGGFARVLLEDYPDKLDADGQRYLNIIHSDARKMGQLIDDLLALARLGRKEMRFAPLDMSELAQEISNELRATHPERNLQFEIQLLPAAWGDRAMIRQVLENLLFNAIKFTQDRETALIQVSGWSEADDNVYCVRDNGIGFDMRYVNKLFGVFQRLHPEKDFEGTGVGLAMVRRIVERHGGRMWAEGRVDAGAAFYFTLSQPSCHLTLKTE